MSEQQKREEEGRRRQAQLAEFGRFVNAKAKDVRDGTAVSGIVDFRGGVYGLVFKVDTETQPPHLSGSAKSVVVRNIRSAQWPLTAAGGRKVYVIANVLGALKDWPEAQPKQARESGKTEEDFTAPAVD